MSKPTKKRRNMVIGIVTAAVLILVTAVLSLRVGEIRISGNHRYSEEQITDILFSGRWDRNLLYCIYKDRFEEHQQIPFIEDYKLVFQSPFELEVIVYEKSMVGYVSYMGSYMYFDKDGIIVESASAKLEGVPWITGLKFGHVSLHQPLPVEDPKIFDQILDLTQILSTKKLIVDKIQYDLHGKASLVMGEITVILGDHSNMNEKIAKFDDMLSVLQGRSGTLYLDTFDVNNPSKSYSFVPRK